MNNVESIISQIKVLCSSVTDNTYDAALQQSYELLKKLHDFGLDKENVYQPLFEYHNCLADSLTRDCVSEILDFIVGWCSPEMHIWKD